ncbi:unnamed protein product [Parnassius apollo]|uniref:(apollo) hypothetical protein n=1 Tax=Parnassius apollo TaxID=110799 RepID=A0A8S3XK45_PARAO|nr:unnamed protein product [Parnassius apollo]
MESIVNCQLIRYLEDHQLISDRQYGFRRGRSAGGLLVYLTHRWAEAVESKDEALAENSDNSSSDPDVPAAPSPDIPAAPSPDIPAAPSPEIPATPSPDIPIAPSPDIPIAPSPDIPIAPSPDILAEPSLDIPGPLPPPADHQTPSSSQQLNSEIFIE